MHFAIRSSFLHFFLIWHPNSEIVIMYHVLMLLLVFYLFISFVAGKFSISGNILCWFGEYRHLNVNFLQVCCVLFGKHHLRWDAFYNVSFITPAP
jgi:hypothetical protein